MWDNLVRYGSYGYAFRELANIVAGSRTSRAQQEARGRNINLLVGLGVGTAMGLTAGILVAPRSGRETREKLASRTSEIVENLKEKRDEAKKETKGK
ncbi:MAG: YtxH domain-containing protein [Desulfosalsimonadaceae bacterium]